MADETNKMTTIDFIIGLPPITTRTGDTIHTLRSNQALSNTMPQAIIQPGNPSFESGMTLFQRVDAFRSDGSASSKQSSNTNFYMSILEDHYYTLDSSVHRNGVNVAYIADNFPTDTFTNEYGENFLQKFTDIASEGAASLAQMFGVRNAMDVLGAGVGKLAETKGAVGDFVKSASNYVKDLGKQFEGAKGMTNMIGRLAAGSRIDFPMVWKTSAFQPSYTMTIRLYNPNPGSLESTKKYIIGPIAALMLLGIPISQDSSTYSWPFLHRVTSKGIYDLDPAYIQNITIVKGGDQQQISYRQSLSVVDVRIDFGSLFSSMLAARQKDEKTRPTLRGYLKAMESQKPAYAITGGSLADSENRTALNSAIAQEGATSIRNLQGPTQDRGTLDADTPATPADRVSSQIKKVAEQLEDLIPDGFRISTN